MKNKRILLAGANPYNANKGVAALAIASIKIIYDVISDKEGEYEICVYNHEFKNTYDAIHCPEGDIVFQNIYPSDLFSFSKIFKTITSRWRLYNLREFLKVDYVFNISAGDGFSDIYGTDSFYSLTNINRLCRWFRKPYYFLPQTYGPFLNDKIKKRAQKDCYYAAGLMSRDLESTLYANTVLGVNRMNDMIDVAFCLPYTPIQQDKSYKHIGINISQTLCIADRKNQFQVSSTYFQTMKELILHLLTEGYKIHLIPHVANTANNDSNEYYISYKLWNDIHHPNLQLAPFFLSPSDAKSYISSMDMFIGSRMHACIAAFSAGVPVLLLGYSRKFSGLFSETLKYPYLIDLTNGFSKGSIIQIVYNMLKNLSQIKSDILNKNKDIVSPRLDILKRTLKDIING